MSVGTYSDGISPCKERGRVLESRIGVLPGPHDDTEDAARACSLPSILLPKPIVRLKTTCLVS